MTSLLEPPSPDLLGQIYRAAVDEEELPAALRRISSEMKTHSIALLVSDLRDPRGSFAAFNTDDGDERNALYRDYADRDVLLQASEPHLQVGRVLPNNRYLPDRLFMHSDYYQGFCRRFDVHHGMTGQLYRDDHRDVMICAARQRSAPFGQHEIDWLQSLMPHLRSAVDVVKRVGELRLANAAAWAVLDRQPFGVQIFDQAGRPVYCNRTLQDIVDRSSLLSLRGGRLDATAPSLSSWLASPLNVMRRLREHGQPMSTVAQHGSERYHFVLAPLEVEVGFFPRTFYALFVNDAHAIAPSAKEQLRILYKMTDREAAVAICLARGCSAREAAEQFHVAESTIVTYRKKIYAKIGVSRQVDLVRLVGSMHA